MLLRYLQIRHDLADPRMHRAYVKRLERMAVLRAPQHIDRAKTRDGRNLDLIVRGALVATRQHDGSFLVEGALLWPSGDSATGGASLHELGTRIKCLGPASNVCARRRGSQLAPGTSRRMSCRW